MEQDRSFVSRDFHASRGKLDIDGKMSDSHASICAARPERGAEKVGAELGMAHSARGTSSFISRFCVHLKPKKKSICFMVMQKPELAGIGN